MKKIIETNYNRNEFEKDVIQEAMVYTVTLAGATATKLTNAALTTIGLAAGISATATRIQFDTLVGNLPWSSFSKFNITEPRTTSPSIPAGSIPKAGSITITEGPLSEIVYYGSITWTSQTAGFLNNVKRCPTAPQVFTGAAVGSFINVVPVREYIELWNRTGAILYVGNSAAINNTPTNAIQIAIDGDHGIMLEPLQEIWAYSAAGGAVNISEYR